jgi:hypothetical protein
MGAILQAAAGKGGGAIQRPTFTMPEAEQALLTDAYARASVILEYGSGGSTAMAAERPGKTITSVESDRDWAAMRRAWFVQTPPAAGSTVEIVWADIGPTRDWGFPANNGAYLNYVDYPFGVWQAGAMAQPDVVLIDGRFRAGCALAVAFHTAKPVDVYFDDYIDRAQYHAVEHWLGSPEITGRMAHFKVAPTSFDPRDPVRMMKLILRQG